MWPVIKSSQSYSARPLSCSLWLFKSVLFVWCFFFVFFLVYECEMFTKHTTPVYVFHIRLHCTSATAALQPPRAPISEEETTRPIKSTLVCPLSCKLTAKPGNQMSISCQGRPTQWASFVSSHSDRNTSPQWKDVKVNSPQKLGPPETTAGGKTSRVKTLTRNRTLRCHSHLNSCNLGAALHFCFRG